MSDRSCIQSGGKQNVELSAVDLLSCCESCGLGCEGGFLGPAWDYWVEEGKYPSCVRKVNQTPSYKSTCQKGYKTPYAQDKRRGNSSYNVDSNEKTIQKEVMKYGSVEASFTVYEDFLNNKFGIYKRITGEFVGRHAMRIIGWGVENNTPYWLIANSWNEHWGENGYFRILRGHHECAILIRSNSLSN
ncbi:unnamed protein product [Schistosoma rodhaini]|nr:unnamed protein product [Schistosoma rodhaini]